VAFDIVGVAGLGVGHARNPLTNISHNVAAEPIA